MSTLRHALRQLALAPGFSLTVILTLALGIGANTAIFSVVHAVLLSPLPYAQPDRIVSILSRNRQQNLHGLGFAPAGFRDFEKQATSFAAIAASRYNYSNLTGIEKPVQLTDEIVTREFFDVLGVAPVLGRTFARHDAAAGAPPTVVLGYALWQSQFAGRADIVGRTILLDDVPHTVIGVMPRTFKEPFGTAPCWRVFPDSGGENFAAESRFWNVLARLEPGLPPSAVSAELDLIAARLAQSDPKFYAGWDFTLQPLRDTVIGNFHDGLVLVIGASSLVLLIMCANVAGLQLVRAATRRRDTAVRLALGASRWAVAHEYLVESFVLVVVGGTLGVLLGAWGLDLILATLSTGWIPRADEIAINSPVLLVNAAAALLTGLGFGVYPAFRAGKVDAAEALRDGGRGSAGPQSARLRSSLVAGQVALTLVLLVCAGLVVKSFTTMLRVNPGLQVGNTLTLSISLVDARYPTAPKREAYFRRIVERVSALPGVESAGFTQTMPFNWGIPVNFTVQGRDDDALKLPPAFYDSVSPSFFATTRIPLLAGRTFADTDTVEAPAVVVLSQTAAKIFFPHENPLGRHLLLPSPAGQPPFPLEVIGVVGDVPRNGLNVAPPCQVYASMTQRPWFFATLLVRSSLPVEALAPSVERQIWSIDPDQAISDVAPVRDYVRGTLTQPQLYLTLFSLFAVLALFLAALGLYGLVAYSVAQRTREFGIRIAIGAQTADVLRLVLGQGLRLTAAGLAVGLAGAFAAARLMQALLFHTAAYDPLVYGAVVVVLGLVALLAALLPAHRATRVNPITALRAE
ncbi:MAG TPA: ABC transporter permease [Opitutus sp.]|nr:ABC transporter permease [Opitutus sp.]